MTAQAIVPLKEKFTKTRDMLQKLEPQIALALPKHLTPERMIRVTMSALQRTPDLLDCDPRTLAAAVVQASELGLEPSSVLGHAYLVPFNNKRTGRKEVQLIPGYKGLMELARRSGQISTISVNIVRERDEYDYRLGLKPNIFHRPYPGADAGVMVAVYAVANMKDGGVQFEWMWKAQVDAVKKQSRASNNGPWVTHYEPMACKTALRRLCKMLPVSIEPMQRAIALDEQDEIGRPQRLDINLAATDEEMAAADDLDALADRISGKEPVAETEEAETVEATA